MFDASFDIFTELSYENSSILLIHSRLYPHTNTHTHTHTHTHIRGQISKLERWAEGRNAETMEEFSQRVCLAADGRREKKTNGDSRHGVANPALLFIMARRGKSGKYTGARGLLYPDQIFEVKETWEEKRGCRKTSWLYVVSLLNGG